MARYIPKSKVSILQTPGNKFVIASTNQPYQGSYMELSDGSYFAGNNPQKPKERLILKKPLAKNIEPGNNNLKYGKLKRPIYNNLSKLTSVPVSKPKPTIKDYNRGYFTRHFCKRVNNQFDYIEIDKKTYDALVSQDPKYDFNLYEVGNIKWVLLDTPKYTVSQINKNNITQKANIYLFLTILFPNLTEYEPTHTDDRGILYYDSGRPYEGYYHIHPTKGFMEGATHNNKSHRTLQASPPKGTPKSIKNFSNKKYLKSKNFSPPTENFSPPTKRSNSSGGRGGY